MAEEQGVLQQKVVALETEVERHNTEIRNLQKQLKEAEQLLVWFFIYFFLSYSSVKPILSNFRLQQFFKQSKNYNQSHEPIESPSLLRILSSLLIAFPLPMLYVLLSPGSKAIYEDRTQQVSF